MVDVSKPLGYISFDALWFPEHFESFLLKSAKNEADAGKKWMRGSVGVVQIGIWVIYFILPPIFRILEILMVELNHTMFFSNVNSPNPRSRYFHFLLIVSL